jgi:FkbM family methyltransferase
MAVNDSSYLHQKFIHRINPDHVRTIFECGSRDCLDAIALQKYYPSSTVWAFECNPEAIELCKANLNGTPDIHLIEKAVYNRDGLVDFFPTDMERSINKELGASSLLWHRDNKHEFFQKQIQVECTRLDTFMIQHHLPQIDLLCMDVQGVELEVFEGLGKMLPRVRHIITEVVFEHYYRNDHLFEEIQKYLYRAGFHLLAGSGLLGNRKSGLTNCLFKNRKAV